MCTPRVRCAGKHGLLPDEQAGLICIVVEGIRHVPATSLQPHTRTQHSARQQRAQMHMLRPAPCPRRECTVPRTCHFTHDHSQGRIVKLHPQLPPLVFLPHPCSRRQTATLPLPHTHISKFGFEFKTPTRPITHSPRRAACSSWHPVHCPSCASSAPPSRLSAAATWG